MKKPVLLKPQRSTIFGIVAILVLLSISCLILCFSRNTTKSIHDKASITEMPVSKPLHVRAFISDSGQKRLNLPETTNFVLLNSNNTGLVLYDKDEQVIWSSDVLKAYMKYLSPEARIWDFEFYENRIMVFVTGSARIDVNPETGETRFFGSD